MIELRSSVRFAVFWVAMFSASSGVADTYMYVDPKGVISYGAEPPTPQHKVVMKVLTCSEMLCGKDRSKRYATTTVPSQGRRYTKLIEHYAQRHNLSPALIHAVITTESAYNPKAVSHAGAMGLMQLMPATAERYGVRDPHDPNENVAGGVHYLSDLLAEFRNLTLALAAYNAGEEAVRRYGNRVPPFPETRKYVRKVLRNYRRYYGRS